MVKCIYKYMNDQYFQEHRGLSGKKMDLGMWYLQHAVMIKKIITASLFIIAFISWTYTIISFVWYLSFGMKEDQKVVDELADSAYIGHKYFLINAPRDLSISAVGAVINDKDKDYYVKIFNSNEKHWAEIVYSFVSGEKEIEAGKEFILPDSEKYIMALSKDGEDAYITPYFKSRVIWHRINNKKIKDYKAYQADRLNVVIDQIDFVPYSQIDYTQKLKQNSLSFRAVNKSPYNYAKASFPILLYRGSELVGIHRQIVENFYSGKEVATNLSWLGQIGRADEVVITPDINILDDANFIAYKLD